MTKLQSIQLKRAEYEHKRRKKFLYLKHTKQLNNYYIQKSNKAKSKAAQTEEKLRWVDKLAPTFQSLFKRLRTAS